MRRKARKLRKKPAGACFFDGRYLPEIWREFNWFAFILGVLLTVRMVASVQPKAGPWARLCVTKPCVFLACFDFAINIIEIDYMPKIAQIQSKC